MGYGTWSPSEFKSYSYSAGRSVLDDGSLDIKTSSAAQVYKQRGLNSMLNPYGVTRLCADSEEHPNTVPVILALDVTGSMGQTAVEVAAELNKIMTRLYEEVNDVEFMIMGIGDFAYDDAALQVSQFESDIRIAEQLDKLWFEFGGGGNTYESYTAAWAFANTQVNLDCWKRGKKGIIITMGDEELNPYIPPNAYNTYVGQQYSDTELNTSQLYDAVKDRFDIYHINVHHRTRGNEENIATFRAVIGGDHVYDVPVNGVAQTIVDIIENAAGSNSRGSAPAVEFGEVTW